MYLIDNWLKLQKRFLVISIIFKNKIISFKLIDGKGQGTQGTYYDMANGQKKKPFIALLTKVAVSKLYYNSTREHK